MNYLFNKYMNKKILIIILIVIGVIAISLFGYFYINKSNEVKSEVNNLSHFTKSSTVSDVMNNKSFEGFGNLIFPVDRNFDSSTRLDDIDDIYVWYNYINDDTTVEIVNYMKDEMDSGHPIFYHIYSEEEMKADPEKRNTGIFYFRGKPGNKMAILNAGGGFMYVGAMQDSFPHALELSKKGYNAFALIYRPSTAMEDLARAVAFIFENKDELEVDTSNYSVWGGSAGARMAAWLGNYGTESFGEKSYPKPATVVMQYTGLSEVTGNEPPTYSCVGTNDGIANYQIMEERTNQIKASGTDAEIEIFEGLPHGFGLGIGTNAEGWIDNAVKFWKEHM